MTYGSIDEIYQEFTPAIIAEWKTRVQSKPGYEWSGNKIVDLLPFVESVPGLRIARNQSLMGFTLISLPSGAYQNDEDLVRYGLEPLLNTGILTQDDAVKLADWYNASLDTITLGGGGSFKKEITLGDGSIYTIFTSRSEMYPDRDLLLQPGNL